MFSQLASALLLLGLTAGSAQDREPLLRLAPGLQARVLIRTGETMSDGSVFAPKPDRTSYFATGSNRGYLLIGHEIRFGKDGLDGRFSRLSIEAGKLVESVLWFSGGHNFCAGGVTPWGTLLSGEEYPLNAFPGHGAELDARYMRQQVRPEAPEARFGWIYEVNPKAPGAVRRSAMGRFSHEGIVAVSETEFYLTEDFEQGHLFRFIADHPRNLSSGKLFAYQRERSEWLEIKDIYNARIEADTRGATAFNRLEDIVLGSDGALYLAETGDAKHGDPYGRILRFEPDISEMQTWLKADGKRLANPDNLVFDLQGRLLICEDQSNENMKAFGPNQILRHERNGSLSEVMALNPPGEPSGPSFSPDGKTLFMSFMQGDQSMVLAIDGYR